MCSSQVEGVDNGCPSQVNSSEVDVSIYPDTSIDNIPLEYHNEIDVLGIGLCLISTPTWEIYNDSTLSEPHSVDLFHPDLSGVRPIYFKPDYGIFYLVVLENHSTYIRVQKNRNDIGFLKMSGIERVVSWSEFLLGSSGINNMDWTENPPLESKDGVKRVEYDTALVHSVIQCLGDWIQISNEKKQKCWIRWRENDHLLINVYLLT
jgi:hypothetical protein